MPGWSSDRSRPRGRSSPLRRRRAHDDFAAADDRATVSLAPDADARSDDVWRCTVCGAPRDVPLDVRAPANAMTALQTAVPRQRPFVWLGVRVP